MLFCHFYEGNDMFYNRELFLRYLCVPVSNRFFVSVIVNRNINENKQINMNISMLYCALPCNGLGALAGVPRKRS
jgi:hypothetical protein